MTNSALKPLYAAFILSMTLHILLIALVKLPHNTAKRSITPVEIVRKSLPKYSPPPELSAPAAAPPKPLPAFPQRPFLPPAEAAPKLQAETPSVIIPAAPKPDNPPRPMSLDEFLGERQKESLRVGPDRSVKGIAEDYLKDAEAASGEESVSFNHLAFKYDAYFYNFARSLYREWKYPDASVRKGESGIVRVNFSVTREGKITDITLAESSGYPALDREVLRALKSMDAVPLPDSLELNLLKISGYFIYSIDGLYRLF